VFPEAIFSTCGTLTEARSILVKNAPNFFHLVVCDEHLPDGRGSQFISEGLLGSAAVLSVSSDEAPELPGSVFQAGARFFLRKQDITDRLFTPLVLAMVSRSQIEAELAQAHLDKNILQSVKTLVATLRHEINNPLGAVLGAAYLLKAGGEKVDANQQEAAELIETSGRRIKHVLDELCSAIALESVTKADQKVYHIPGDKPWDDSKK
jgi:signal transduction histidine kinase